MTTPHTDWWADAPCALVMIDRELRISAANHVAQDWTGRGELDLVGTRLSALFSAGGRIYTETQFGPLLALDGGVSELAVEILGPDDNRLPVLLTARLMAGSPDADADVWAQVSMTSAADRRRYEQEVRQGQLNAEAAALNAEAVAAEGARMQRRLELLARVSASLAGTSEFDEALSAVGRAVVSALGDWCLIYLVEPGPSEETIRLELAAAEHVRPEQNDSLRMMGVSLPDHLTIDSALRRSAESGRPELLGRITTEHVADATDDPDVEAQLASFALDVGSVIVVPLIARGQRVAVMVVARIDPEDPLDRDDLAAAVDLGARTAQAVDILRLRRSEHETSVALQEALLTPTHAFADIEVVSRYQPAAHHASVGGDWYDAITRPDGTQLLVIGDVVGHGNEAAAAMGQLRSIIRTLAYTGTDAPDVILGRADQTARGLHVDTLATVTIVALEPGPGDRRLIWSSAGHPSPILVSVTGAAELVGAHDPLLGVVPETRRRSHTARMAVGDTLLLFTDGLVERRDEDMDSSIGRLLAAVTAGSGSSLEAMADGLLGSLVDPRHDYADDVALLLIRLR